MTGLAVAPARKVRLEEGPLTISPVMFDGACAGVLIVTPGTQTLMTADQADTFADELREKAATARLAVAPAGGVA